MAQSKEREQTRRAIEEVNRERMAELLMQDAITLTDECRYADISDED